MLQKIKEGFMWLIGIILTGLGFFLYLKTKNKKENNIESRPSHKIDSVDIKVEEKEYKDNTNSSKFLDKLAKKYKSPIIILFVLSFFNIYPLYGDDLKSCFMLASSYLNELNRLRSNSEGTKYSYKIRDNQVIEMTLLIPTNHYDIDNNKLIKTVGKPIIREIEIKPSISKQYYWFNFDLGISGFYVQTPLHGYTDVGLSLQVLSLSPLPIEYIRQLELRFMAGIKTTSLNVAYKARLDSLKFGSNLRLFIGYGYSFYHLEPGFNAGVHISI